LKIESFGFIFCKIIKMLLDISNMNILMNICRLSFDIAKNEQLFVSVQPLCSAFSKVTERIEIRGGKPGRGFHAKIERGSETTAGREEDQE
jgi:hypothetical protein